MKKSDSTGIKATMFTEYGLPCALLATTVGLGYSKSRLDSPKGATQATLFTSI